MSSIDINIPFKRNYLFEWDISFPNTLNFEGKSKSSYVMSMCKNLTPPSDEFDIDEYAVGTVKMTVIKGEKLGDIKAVYMDDDMDSVYLFHRKWQDEIRNSNLTYVPMRKLCGTGIYSSRTKTVDSTKNPQMTREMFSNGFKNSDSLVQKFPLIYPISVVRSNSDRSGNSTTEVTVTYRQYPYIQKPKALTMLKG